MYMKILILTSIILILLLIMRIYGNDNLENFENAELTDENREDSNNVKQSNDNDETNNDETNDDETNDDETINVKIENYDKEDENREKRLEMNFPMAFFKEDHGEFCKCDQCINHNNEYHLYLHHTINDITKRKKSPKKKKENNNLMSEENINFILKSIASSGNNKKNKKGKLSSYGAKVPKNIRKLLKQRPKFSSWHSPTGLIEHFGPLPANEYIL
jgi:hypothetical protein